MAYLGALGAFIASAGVFAGGRFVNTEFGAVQVKDGISRMLAGVLLFIGVGLIAAAKLFG